MDDSAVILGIPAGSFSQDIVPQDDSYFFVVLRAPQEVFRRQISAPIRSLKMGRQLGAGTAARCCITCIQNVIAPVNRNHMINMWLYIPLLQGFLR